MDFSIREYKETDRAELVRCMEELQDYVASVDPHGQVTRKPEFGELYTVWLLDLIRETNGVIYFACLRRQAEVDGKIVGCVAGILRDQEPREIAAGSAARYGRVQELYVDSTHRGGGVGKALMEKCEDYFRTNGCTVAYVEVFAPNKNAYEFYRASGYTDIDINLMKKL
ncbi:MAG: GNAT family N-acetyltransferase [bacterium]|nr:GNAT family N-acetyltransferase [bacterium]